MNLHCSQDPHSQSPHSHGQQAVPAARDRSMWSSGLLLCGVLLGAILAGTGLFEKPPAPSETGVLAEVNGWTIRQSDFEQFITALERGKGSELPLSERRNLLQRMIEEKLILQRGLELGLVESDATVRKAISNAMIQTITAEVSALEPDEADLETFYRNNSSYFARSARLRVQPMMFLKKNDSKQAYQRAVSVFNALQQGANIEALLSTADESVLTVPNVLLPPHKLRDYIGPKLLELAMSMQSGQVSAPQEQQDAYVILLVHENEPASSVPLAQIRDRVTAEFQRRAGEQALRDYLEVLSLEADIRIAPEFGGLE